MEKLAEVLQALATQLGVTVEYLLPLLVEKTAVDWVAKTVAVVLFCVPFLALSAAKGKKFLVWCEDEDWGGLIVTWACLVLFSLVALFGRIVTVGIFLCPEAATVERLLAMVR